MLSLIVDDRDESKHVDEQDNYQREVGKGSKVTTRTRTQQVSLDLEICERPRYAKKSQTHDR